MSIKRQIQSIKFIMDILSPDKRLNPVLPLCVQKPEWKPSEGSKTRPFEQVLPEDEGVSTVYIKDYVSELLSDKTIDLHHLMILRHGRIIWKQSFNGYDPDIWHECFSLSKTITGIAIGFMQHEGLIDPEESISDIFEEKITKLQYNARKHVTVRHLLNMQSGVLFNESSSLNEPDWVKGYFDAVSIKKAGKIFYYDSMNSFMLSAIVKKKTGMNMMDYLKSRLWEPLGITDVYWELTPDGIEKGGWGLYLTVEDAAKLGQLFLNDGKWNGEVVIPSEIIDAMLREKVDVPAWMGDYDYGRHIWVGRHDNTFLFNGIFSQNILGFRNKDMLIVVNCGNEELAQAGPFFAITHKYFGKNYFPSDVPLARPATQETHEALPDKNRRASFTRFANKVKNKKYGIDSKNAVRGALLPIIPQATHNNFSQGITGISFVKRSERDGRKRLPVLDIYVKEGDMEYVIPVVMGKITRLSMQIGIETYELAVTAEVVRGKLKVRLSFLELACSRTIVFRVRKDSREMEIAFDELPSSDVVVKNVEMFIDNLFKSPALANVAKKAFSPFRVRIAQAFAPVVIAKEE